MSNIKASNGKENQSINRKDFFSTIEKMDEKSALLNIKGLIDRCVKCGVFSASEEVIGFDKCFSRVEECLEEREYLMKKVSELEQQLKLKTNQDEGPKELNAPQGNQIR